MIVDIADGKTEGSITLDQGSFKMVDERNRIALGKDVVIGGEGMKTFYDKILKNFTEKYIKKWGSKVGVVTLPDVEEAGREMWGFDVTPVMKAAVMGRGQPLFQPGQKENVDELFAHILNLIRGSGGNEDSSSAVRQRLEDNIAQLPANVKDALRKIFDSLTTNELPAELGKPVSPKNFITSFRLLGFSEQDGSLYYTFKNGDEENTIRISNHGATASTFQGWNV